MGNEKQLIRTERSRKINKKITWEGTGQQLKLNKQKLKQEFDFLLIIRKKDINGFNKSKRFSREYFYF